MNFGLPRRDFTDGGTRFSLGDLAPAPAATGVALHRLRLTRRRRRPRPSRIWKSDHGGASWTLLPAGDAARRARRRGRRLLRHPVLLRQRRRGRPDQPERRLRRRRVRLRPQPAVRRHLPLRRRRPDLEEPRLRPAPGLPRVRVRPDEHPARRHRQRRRRLALAPTSAAAPTRGRRRSGLAEPQRDRRSTAGRHCAITQFIEHRDHPDLPGPALGRHAGQRHPAQVVDVEHVVRHDQR